MNRIKLEIKKKEKKKGKKILKQLNQKAWLKKAPETSMSSRNTMSEKPSSLTLRHRTPSSWVNSPLKLHTELPYL